MEWQCLLTADLTGQMGLSQHGHRSTIAPMDERPHSNPAWPGWLPLVILPGATWTYVPAHWPRWALMWGLAFTIYVGCKWLTWWDSRNRVVNAWRCFDYLVAWPGLDARSFLDIRTKSAGPAVREWLFAVTNLLVGVALLFGVARRMPADYTYLIGVVGMIGIVMVLHFGVFHLLSCVWRQVGVQAHPLMQAPFAATSLGEFWGRRWNTAFRDLTHRFLFHPLRVRFGARRAILVGFVGSGLIHDIVISLPAGGGYGGPTLFFTISGLGMLFEHSAIGRRLGLGRGWRGWLFTMALLLGPFMLLFHQLFVNEIILPFMHAIGAL